MKYYPIGEFAEAIGVTIQTLRNWDRNGNLKPHHVGKSGYRYYSQEQLQSYLGLKGKSKVNRKIIGYCRVASEKEKDKLQQQVEYVRSYMIAKGYCFEIITDIGSSMNYNKDGLNKLIDMVVSLEVEKVVVLHKDRLFRIGFEMLERLFEKYGTVVEAIDQTDRVEDQELVEDLIQIVASCSSPQHVRNENKIRKMLSELLGNSDISRAQG